VKSTPPLTGTNLSDFEALLATFDQSTILDIAGRDIAYLKGVVISIKATRSVTDDSVMEKTYVVTVKNNDAIAVNNLGITSQSCALGQKCQAPYFLDVPQCGGVI
jgi:hypothetical protein